MSLTAMAQNGPGPSNNRRTGIRKSPSELDLLLSEIGVPSVRRRIDSRTWVISYYWFIIKFWWYFKIYVNEVLSCKIYFSRFFRHSKKSSKSVNRPHKIYSVNAIGFRFSKCRYVLASSLILRGDQLLLIQIQQSLRSKIHWVQIHKSIIMPWSALLHALRSMIER